jgi:hypothetical protein
MRRTRCGCQDQLDSVRRQGANHSRVRKAETLLTLVELSVPPTPVHACSVLQAIEGTFSNKNSIT